MKIKINDLKKISEQFADEAPPNAILNRFAFAMKRSDKKGLSEPNNEIEEYLYKLLYDHFNYNIPINNEGAKILKTILKNGWYQDLIHEPQHSTIYRGMEVNKEYITTALKLSSNEELNSEHEKFANFTFSPRSGIGVTGWTTDYEIAETFATEMDYHGENEETRWGIILAASISDNPQNFIAGVDGLYNVIGFDPDTYQNEVLALGKIKVNYIFWFDKRVTNIK